jgi:hypothetical protein
MAAAGAAGARHVVGMEQKLLFLISGENSGGRHGSDNALP